jgi:hypothetical protein
MCSIIITNASIVKKGANMKKEDQIINKKIKIHMCSFIVTNVKNKLYVYINF